MRNFRAQKCLPETYSKNFARAYKCVMFVQHYIYWSSEYTTQSSLHFVNREQVAKLFLIENSNSLNPTEHSNFGPYFSLFIWKNF